VGSLVVPSIPATQFPELKYFNPTLDDVFRLNVEQRKITAQIHNAFAENHLDAIVMPVYQGTVVLHDTFGVPVYTVLANLIDVCLFFSLSDLHPLTQSSADLLVSGLFHTFWKGGQDR
jgi:hypothetical protein